MSTISVRIMAAAFAFAVMFGFGPVGSGFVQHAAAEKAEKAEAAHGAEKAEKAEKAEATEAAEKAHDAGKDSPDATHGVETGDK